MQVAEIFYSLQGEGILAGMPSVFIRLAGCPLRCPWCDTSYAWDWSSGVHMELGQIRAEVGRWPCRHVVITGGEPMADRDLGPRPGLAALTWILRRAGYHLTIETAGVVLDGQLDCDLVSISPKPGHVRLDVIRGLVSRYDHQIKFVLGPWDLARIQDLLGQLDRIDPSRVMLMPQARTRQELLAAAGQVAQACLESGWRYCPRIQVLLWDGQRGM